MIVFKTPGILDTNMIRVMGVNAKITDSPIGYFGTGLKYALAVIARLNGIVTIVTEGTPYKFGWQLKYTRKKTAAEANLGDILAAATAQGMSYNQMYMNDEPLGFTTDLGKNWEPWMAFRELYSNTLDEGGTTYSLRDEDYVAEVSNAVKDPNNTYILVLLPAFDEAAKNIGQYFLTPKNEPVFRGARVDLYPGPSSAIFYRGIRAMDWPNNGKLPFTVNMTCAMNLTEDRTLKYSWMVPEYLMKDLIEGADFNLLEKWIYPDKYPGVAQLDWTSTTASLPDKRIKAAKTWMETLAGNRVSEKFLSWLRGQTYNYSEIRSSENTPEEKAMIEDVQRIIVKYLGYKDIVNYPVIVAEDLGHYSTLGLAREGKIYIKRSVFAMGLSALIGTVLEEYYHLSGDYEDATRRFQDAILNDLSNVLSFLAMKNGARS